MKPDTSWAHHFQQFSAVHFCVVAVFTFLVAALVATRRCDDVATVQPRRRIMDQAAGWLGLAAAGFVQMVTLWPSRFSFQTALPLHICDIVMFIAPAALILRWRHLRSIAYFWGLGLSSISFIFPDLHFGPADFQFWVFWIAHATIVGAALYDVTGRGFRPNWRDWRFAVAAAVVYSAIIFPIDALLHLDYGYIGKGLNGQKSPADFLGPWPLRVPLMVMMGIAIMLLLLLPWVIHRKMMSDPPAAENSPGEIAPPPVALHRVP
jgi:hypothetical integral membrane protein (TIGR02206 family)